VTTASAKWEEFLNPSLLRTKLISASLFLTAFELLKDSIVGRIKDFFTDGFDETGWRINPKYEKDVLKRNRSPVYASLSWLQENGVIDDQDFLIFERIKKSRNKIAHGLAHIIGSEAGYDYVDVFPELVSLLRKIEVWWVVNVEIPTNPDFQDAEIDEDGIIPGPLLTVQLMLTIALGSDEEAGAYLKEFQQNMKP
jgi:hypothetical protein